MSIYSTIIQSWDSLIVRKYRTDKGVDTWLSIATLTVQNFKDGKPASIPFQMPLHLDFEEIGQMWGLKVTQI